MKDCKIVLLLHLGRDHSQNSNILKTFYTAKVAFRNITIHITPLNTTKCFKVASYKRSPLVRIYHLDTELVSLVLVTVVCYLYRNDHCKYVPAIATRPLNFLCHCL